MVESKKALPKEPRLSYYSAYTNPYYAGHGPLSPPGTRNYYGPTGYPGGGGGYMNGNRFYQQHPHFQVRLFFSLLLLRICYDFWCVSNTIIWFSILSNVILSIALISVFKTRNTWTLHSLSNSNFSDTYSMESHVFQMKIKFGPYFRIEPFIVAFLRPSRRIFQWNISKKI